MVNEVLGGNLRKIYLMTDFFLNYHSVAHSVEKGGKKLKFGKFQNKH